MSNGEITSIVINLAVGAYLAFGYRRHLARSLHGRPAPRALALLAPLITGLGYVVLVATIGYAAVRLTGMLG